MLSSLIWLALVGRPLIVSGLRCESFVDPLNLDVASPKLSWIVSSPDEGQRQSGYQVLVSRSSAAIVANRGDLWDSGRIKSDATIEIPYAGRQLKSAEQVYWRVRVWDSHGMVSTWSSVQTWTMGLLTASDWQARWIGIPRALDEHPESATLLFHKGFQISKPIKRALCFACGLGQYEMWLNGKRVGKDWLTPGWTQYAKTCLADSYDVTSLLQPGANALAMHIGNGMYDMSGDKRGGQQQNKVGPKKAICQLIVEYRDGTREVVKTDRSWKWSWSPETYSGVYGGEDWDARREIKGWLSSGFDDRAWFSVVETAPPAGVLRGLTHSAPPMRLIETRHSVASTTPKPDVLVLNLGQNSPYVPQIKVHGLAGSSIVMRPAELLKPDGTVNQETMRAGKLATYTLRGDGSETWHPSFWYVGSQFWQIEAKDPTGRAIDPRTILDRLDGLLVHADIKPVGTFQCSNHLLNQIHDLIWWAMCSNFASVISDCPHREKSGWLEQDFLCGESLMYSFDMSAMFRKVVNDMRDTQLPNGMVPTMAPEYFIYDGGFRDSVEWGGAYLLLPEMMQSWYGKRGIVSEHYATMKRYVNYLGTKAKANILSNGLGDWNGFGNDPRTPVAITDTAYYFDMVKTLSSFAKSLGKGADSVRYSQLADQIKSSFGTAFFDSASGKIGTGSQSAQATALDLGLIDSADEPAAFAQLLADVKDHDYGISCGEVGHPSLLRTLTRFGRTDLVARIHLQTDKPGYGYQIKKGLTTLAESWDARPISYNHFMLGHLMEWLYADLVGIKPDPLGSAFSKIVIQPRPVEGVDWASGTYDSVRGKISCSWKLVAGRFHMAVTIPANTTATVWVPSAAGSTVRVGYPSKGFGVLLSQERRDGYASVSVTSGTYSFDSVVR